MSQGGASLLGSLVLSTGDQPASKDWAGSYCVRGEAGSGPRVLRATTVSLRNLALSLSGSLSLSLWLCPFLSLSELVSVSGPSHAPLPRLPFLPSPFPDPPSPSLSSP